VGVVLTGPSANSQIELADAYILEQLDRIRLSVEFDLPERERNFLTNVVDEAPAGSPNRIKAYSISMPSEWRIW
jgi:hypothetical protein